MIFLTSTWYFVILQNRFLPQHCKSTIKSVAFFASSGWWQLKYCWNFHPYLGKMNPFWLIFFSKGLVKNHQPVITFCQDKKNGTIWVSTFADISGLSNWRRFCGQWSTCQTFWRIMLGDRVVVPTIVSKEGFLQREKHLWFFPVHTWYVLEFCALNPPKQDPFQSRQGSYGV